MEQKKIDRINELARIAKQRELTADEQDERQLLRREYIDSFRKSLVSQLENTYIQYPDGRKVKVEKNRERS